MITGSSFPTRYLISAALKVPGVIGKSAGSAMFNAPYFGPRHLLSPSTVAGRDLIERRGRDHAGGRSEIGETIE
jgi:hypothetical protein